MAPVKIQTYTLPRLLLFNESQIYFAIVTLGASPLLAIDGFGWHQ